MKKTLVISILFAIILMACATVVNATTSSTLADEIYSKGKKYGVTSADKVKIERYLSENEVSDEDANQIISKVDEAVAVMEKAGVVKYGDLTQSQRDELKTIAKEAADIIDVKLVYKSG